MRISYWSSDVCSSDLNSLVYLNANSRLYFEKSLLGSFSREVRLEGEAFFKVEKDSGVDGYRKFLVHTNGMAVEVLGTTFNVRARHSVSSVTLQTGKVLVNIDRKSTRLNSSH